MKVGMAEMPASSAMSAHLSTSTLQKAMFGNSPLSAILSSSGAILLHGGHHSAKKSTSTAFSPFFKSSSSALLEICCTIEPVTQKKAPRCSCVEVTKGEAA
eukprot:CAMPEP_0170244312 /NCGR_PEP_ID=MMETSP0116_2-20130129/21935_1 /TAXON_ID=400756 /ORGANISM="Durinskia baltica, Strain CSIRO CS-38" /LENGTH=100 /DNA_ID=CAMNT_0010495173 /DNA_START=158 /DNA_END=460 /DNA_ORIENTATION=+